MGILLLIANVNVVATLTNLLVKRVYVLLRSFLSKLSILTVTLAYCTSKQQQRKFDSIKVTKFLGICVKFLSSLTTSCIMSICHISNM